MPSYQGQLDGLCGPYAIANALEQCGLAINHETFFQIACERASGSRWPSLLWEGTSFAEIRRMVSACLSSPANTLAIKARYPFRQEPPPTNRDYWMRFDELFDDERTLCGIVGVIRPHPHWIVISRDGGRLIFTSSDADSVYQRKNRAAVHAGYRRRKPGQWLIDRRELVVFSARRPFEALADQH